MAKTKQKYLVLKVVRLDEKNELYKNIYRVTDETGTLNLLGYYDEKETEPVVILTNKAVLEYDWNGIAARVQKLNKDFCEQFVDKSKIIVITEEAKTEEMGGVAVRSILHSSRKKISLLKSPRLKLLNLILGSLQSLRDSFFRIRLNKRHQKNNTRLLSAI